MNPEEDCCTWCGDYIDGERLRAHGTVFCDVACLTGYRTRQATRPSLRLVDNAEPAPEVAS